MGSFIEKSKPYLAMISLQFGYAGMNIMTKTSLTRGMSHYVLVVYRHASATIVLAPFAFFLERKKRPKLTFFTFCQIFVLGLLGPVIDQNFYYLGLQYTSPTYACALSNLLPVMTFAIALLFRMESVNIRLLRSQAKIVGTIVCVGGALLMTLYNGPIVPMFWSPHHQHHKNNQTPVMAPPDKTKWFLGSLLIIAGTLAWSCLFVLQAVVLKKYTAEISLVTLICFLGTLQAAVIGFAIEHDLSKWALGWDINLLSAVYSGVVTSALAYYLQGLCMRIKGPVFASAFSPLMMIIVAIMGSIILSENIYLGSLLGGVLITIGLYAVLWGKAKDSKLSANQDSSEMLSISDEDQFPTKENKVDYVEPASKLLMTKGNQPHQCNAEGIAVIV